MDTLDQHKVACGEYTTLIGKQNNLAILVFAFATYEKFKTRFDETFPAISEDNGEVWFGSDEEIVLVFWQTLLEKLVQVLVERDPNLESEAGYYLRGMVQEGKVKLTSVYADESVVEAESAESPESCEQSA